MRVWRTNELGLLQKIEKLRDLESDVLANRVRSELSLGEVLENSLEGLFKFVKDWLTDFVVFLKNKDQLDTLLALHLPLLREIWPCFCQPLGTDAR